MTNRASVIARSKGPFGRVLSRAEGIADRTPSDRNRYVDFLRAFSILVVVFGHWLMAAPEVIDGQIKIGHMISETRWAQWLTWLLQVMPVFFFVGGYSNLVGWRSAVAKGVPYGRWLSDRLRRLTYPLLPLLGLWIPASWIAWRAGLDPRLVTVGSQAALVPVWFLATYILIVMVAPLTIALWERVGVWTIVGFAGVAALIDVASLGFDVPVVRWLNYLFVWNAVHALGYLWADGRVGAMRVRVGMAVAGLLGLASLVYFGPYPVAMVGLDTDVVTNSNPPRVTLVALGLFQFGLAMSMESRARAWLAQRRPWTAVVAVNGSIMSLYLWHLTVMVAVIGVAFAAGGLGLHIAAGGATWWATRPVWLGLLLILTLGVVALVARFERPGPLGEVKRPVWRATIGVIGLCAGLGLLAKYGVADADGLNGMAIALTVMGLAVGGVLSGQSSTGTSGAETSVSEPVSTS